MKIKKNKNNIQINIFSKDGVKSGKIVLPEDFVVSYSPILLGQYLRVFENNTHSKVPVRKTRSAVSISKRKIYRQKGTGRARHGARSAPIFVGGGLAHGPKGLKRFLAIPSSFKKKALLLALNLKVKENKLVSVSSFFEFKKIKEVLEFIKKVSEILKTSTNRVLFVTTEDSYKETSRKFSNIAGLVVRNYANINAYDVFVSNLVVLESGLFEKNNKENAKN